MSNSTLTQRLKASKKNQILVGLISVFIFLVFLMSIFTILKSNSSLSSSIVNQHSIINNPTTTPSTTPTLPPVPVSKILDNDGYHIFQTFNNCGPASLSMALRFYDIVETQAKIGNDLRPFQVPGGDNDDKSVTLKELAEYSKNYGFVPYHLPMGNSEIVKQLIAQDLPVITRTWLTADEDIGHYRIIKGYDENTGTYIQDDSLQNKNLSYTYDEFNEIWKKFNYEYLILVPQEKVDTIDRILGENTDPKTAWQSAVNNSIMQLEENGNDIDARFNLSVAYFNVGEYEKSVEEFEKVENLLSFRTLWYQIEPIEAYYSLKNYDRVFEITDKILNNQNRAFSELYIIRGKIYQEQGQVELARQEFQNAVFYNQNKKEAQDLLNSI